jgi:hypothetical protein
MYFDIIKDVFVKGIVSMFTVGFGPIVVAYYAFFYVIIINCD